MSGKLKIESTVAGNELLVKISGVIDEDADFSPIETTPHDLIRFDFGACSGINSCGIREWIDYIETINAEKNLVYENCSQFIIEQINMVSGFFRDGAEVKSFFAPYFCESCDEEKKILLTLDQIKDRAAPEIKCDKCSGELEFDAIEEQYFQFVK